MEASVDPSPPESDDQTKRKTLRQLVDDAVNHSVSIDISSDEWFFFEENEYVPFLHKMVSDGATTTSEDEAEMLAKKDQKRIDEFLNDLKNSYDYEEELEWYKQRKANNVDSAVVSTECCKEVYVEDMPSDEDNAECKSNLSEIFCSIKSDLSKVEVKEDCKKPDEEDYEDEHADNEEEISPFTSDLLKLRKQRQMLRQQTELFRKPQLFKSGPTVSNRHCTQAFPKPQSSSNSPLETQQESNQKPKDRKRKLLKKRYAGDMPLPIFPFTRYEMKTGKCRHFYCAKMNAKLPPDFNYDDIGNPYNRRSIYSSPKISKDDLPFSQAPMFARPFYDIQHHRPPLCHFYDPHQKTFKPFFENDNWDPSKDTDDVSRHPHYSYPAPFPYWSDQSPEGGNTNDNDWNQQCPCQQSNLCDNFSQFTENILDKKIDETDDSNTTATTTTTTTNRQRSVKLSFPRKSMIQPNMFNNNQHQ